MTEEQRVLEAFLSMPIKSSMRVFEAFINLNRFGTTYSINDSKRGFVYVPGKRDDRVLLVAHADTVWDREYCVESFKQEIVFENGFYKGKNDTCGIGADDRAGCAMLYLLRDSGHSLLITDGEEHGQIGATFIRQDFGAIYDALNNHSYMIQLDRRNANDYKTYHLPVTDEFREFIESSTGYKDAGKNSMTDIVSLCRDICGVNLSVGYYHEHHEDECLCYNEWLNTLNIVRKMLKGKQKKFLLKE